MSLIAFLSTCLSRVCVSFYSFPTLLLVFPLGLPAVVRYFGHELMLVPDRHGHFHHIFACVDSLSVCLSLNDFRLYLFSFLIFHFDSSK